MRGRPGGDKGVHGARGARTAAGAGRRRTRALDRSRPARCPRLQGYLVLEGFASAEEVAALNRRAAELVAEVQPAESQSIFSTRNQARGAGGGCRRFSRKLTPSPPSPCLGGEDERIFFTKCVRGALLLGGACLRRGWAPHQAQGAGCEQAGARCARVGWAPPSASARSRTRAHAHAPAGQARAPIPATLPRAAPPTHTHTQLPSHTRSPPRPGPRI